MSSYQRLSHHTFNRYLPLAWALCTLLALPITAQAHNKVVIIPLSGDDAKPLQNIISVAKSNGDFTSPLAALNSIDDASADNPYLIVIAPGVYTLNSSLEMKQHVDVTGSGENVTTLVGSFGSMGVDVNSGTVKLANESVLSQLTVKNIGSTAQIINGIYSPGRLKTAKVQDVSIIATGGVGANDVSGVRLTTSSASLKNVTIHSSGGINCFGVQASSHTQSTIKHTVVDVSACDTSIGFYVSSFSGVILKDVETSAAARITAFGVLVSGVASATIRHSFLDGDSNGLSVDGINTANVSQTSIGHGVSGLGSFNCAASDNGAGVALDADCE